jgi:hypothetical protein
MSQKQKEDQMKYLKMLGLAAIAAAALAAFVGTGTASATVLCSTTTSPCPEAQKYPSGTRVGFTLTAGSSLRWINGETVLETCKEAVLKTDITNAGSATSTVTSKNNTLSFSQCTFNNSFTKLGGLEIHNISGTSNGTVTAVEEVGWTFVNPLFGSCIYGWQTEKGVGTITEGKPATLDFNLGITRLSGSSITCPENGQLEGNLTQTEPSNTTLSVGAS